MKFLFFLKHVLPWCYLCFVVFPMMHCLRLLHYLLWGRRLCSVVCVCGCLSFVVGSSSPLLCIWCVEGVGGVLLTEGEYCFTCSPRVDGWGQDFSRAPFFVSYSLTERDDYVS